MTMRGKTRYNASPKRRQTTCALDSLVFSHNGVSFLCKLLKEVHLYQSYFLQNPYFRWWVLILYLKTHVHTGNFAVTYTI